MQLSIVDMRVMVTSFPKSIPLSSQVMFFLCGFCVEKIERLVMDSLDYDS
jgi:hypothetical protein